MMAFLNILGGHLSTFPSSLHWILLLCLNHLHYKVLHPSGHMLKKMHERLERLVQHIVDREDGTQQAGP